MTLYDVGEPVVLTGLFYSDSALSVLADPTAVTLTIRDPSGSLATPTPTHASLGTWTYAWTPLVRGMHEIHWVGTGAVAAIEQYGIDVRGGFPAITDLVDVQTVRARLRMPKDDDDQDAGLEDLIATASAHLMNTYEQEWVPAGAVPEARSFTYRGGGIIDLSPYNARAGTVTAVSLTPDGGSATALTSGTGWFEMPKPSAYGVTDYLRLNSAMPFFSLPQTVSVTATWGYPSVPASVRRAATITVMHWYREQSSRPSGFTEPEEGTSDDRVAIPQRARWLLRPFERMAYT